MENNIGKFNKIENNPKSLLEKGRLIIKKIEGISDPKLKERFLRMLKILSIPILLSLPNLGLSQNESKDFNDFFDNFNSLEMSKGDEKDNGSKIKLNVAVGKFGYESNEKATENKINTCAQLSGYKTLTEKFLEFEETAKEYLNIFQTGEQKFANESTTRINHGKELDPNSNYYFIPKEKLNDFFLIYDDQDYIDHLNEIYLSEDGNFFIISDDIQDYLDTKYLINNRIILNNYNIEPSPEEIKKNIWVDLEEARKFDISISDMKESIYNTLDVIDKIEITTDDLSNHGYSSNLPEKSNPEEYFLVDKEKQEQIEKNFIENLKEASKDFSEGQKLAVLSTLGNIFTESYNNKIEEKGIGGTGKISLSVSLMAAKIFSSSGWQIPIGVCRHINLNLIKTAHDALGLDGFVKQAYAKGLHAIGGIRLKDGNICFIDYNNIIKTPTPDLEEAIGFYESSVGRIDGPAVLGNENGEIKTKISSRATKSREEAIHFSGSQDKLDKIFEQGKIIETEEGITLTIEDEKQELELGNKSLVLSCIRLDKSKEVFNSLDELYGVRIAPEFNFGEFNSHISSFLLHEKIKSLEPGQLSTTTETGIEFGLDFLHKFNLNDNLYLNLINTMNGYGIYNLNDKNISAFSLDDSYSINLGYIVPNKLSEFHLGAKQHLVGSVGNIQTGGFDKDGVRPHIKLSELNIGGKVLVNKKVSVDIDLSLQKGDIYSGFEVAGKINKNNLGLGIQYSNKQSKELSFLPHTQEGNLIISNRGQLMGKEFIVTVAGGIQNKNYKTSKDTQYNFKAGISMLF